MLTTRNTSASAGNVHLYACVGDAQWDKLKYPIVDQGKVAKVTTTKTVTHQSVSETILYKLGKATN